MADTLSNYSTASCVNAYGEVLPPCVRDNLIIFVISEHGFTLQINCTKDSHGMSKYFTESLDTCPNASETLQVDLLGAEELFLTPVHFPLS